MKWKPSLRGREVSVLKVLTAAGFPGCARAPSDMVNQT